MFNVGIVSGMAGVPLVALTDKELFYRNAGSYYRYELTLWTDGSFSRFNELSQNIFSPGEWYIHGATGGIGAGYEHKVELVAGSPLQFGDTNGEWVSIENNRTIRWQNAEGRVRVSIRKAGTSNVLTSALFWTTGYAP